MFMSSWNKGFYRMIIIVSNMCNVDERIHGWNTQDIII